MHDDDRLALAEAIEKGFEAGGRDGGGPCSMSRRSFMRKARRRPIG